MAENIVPGVMHCAKCNFRLVRTTLYVLSGTAGPGESNTEPCPNGCGPLWPVTWEQEAREAWERAEEAHSERVALRARAEKAEAERDAAVRELERVRDVVTRAENFLDGAYDEPDGYIVNRALDILNGGDANPTHGED